MKRDNRMGAMMIGRTIAAVALLMGATAGVEASNLSYFCDDDIAATIDHSSALAYGVDIAPPSVRNSFPISERTVADIAIDDAGRLGLIAMNARGEAFHRVCGGRLCDVDDALATIRMCRDTAGCQIVGAVKNATFYPLYLSDRDGGHICKGETTGMSQNMELMGNIARVLTESDELRGIDWEEFSVVFAFSREGSVNNTYGYAYQADGEWTAISFRPREVRLPVDQYHEWLSDKHGAAPIAMLFQFNRETRKVHADFEYEDATRWKVSPDTIDKIIDELRPKLGNGE